MTAFDQDPFLKPGHIHRCQRIGFLNIFEEDTTQLLTSIKSKYWDQQVFNHHCVPGLYQAFVEHKGIKGKHKGQKVDIPRYSLNPKAVRVQRSQIVFTKRNLEKSQNQ